jgi:cysteine desulfurase family protein (TIGR01976 family)
MRSTTSTNLQIDTHKVEWIRNQFPGLHRREDGEQVVFLDGPAGTQVPKLVADAVCQHLLHHNANHAGLFSTSQENDAIVAEAHRAAADFLGAKDADEIAFGGNMTTLTMHLSRSLGRHWTRDDEIIVTRMDHDANVRPWVLAAADAGAKVHFIPVNTADCTLDQDAYAAMLGPRTRLVAVGAASNSVGTINPIKQMVDKAHQHGAEVFVDAVHYAPHRLIDVEAWGCDFLACSAYKFFGPHVGILWGRRERMQSLQPYKLNPASDNLPDRWMTGTQNFASIAGTLAAINYLADLGRWANSDARCTRRVAIAAVFGAIRNYEEKLIWQLIEGLQKIDGIKIYGIVDRQRSAERMPTISFTCDRITPRDLAKRLAKVGIFAWHGNYYAWELSHALGREPDGMLRMGIVHYNTAAEIQRTIDAVSHIVAAGG